MTPRPTPPVWRSILYVPGNVAKFIDKAHERGADCVLIDLEDSVQPAQKPEARAMLPEAMKKVVKGGADVAVRINRPMRLAMPDIEAAVRPGLSALFITKTESVQHLRLLNEAFTPKPEEVAHARKLIEADRTAQAEGRGSFSVDGKMIDIPVIDRARKLLARHEAIEHRQRR